MISQKIKILHSGETTGAYSGFGKYGREILKRLYLNDRFELAEAASFGCIEDDKWNVAKGKWLYYPMSVVANHPEFQAYNSNPGNAFGGWRFDRVCLDFKPDFVFSVRDPWCDDHVLFSPLRKFFNFTWMPTVDSAPQQAAWIDKFISCDKIFTYSDWAIPVLEKQSNGKIKNIQSAYPGVELDIFKPMDKKAIRKKYGLPEDIYIIGMVSRNQIRKLFPELFKAFRKYLDKYGNTEIGKKTYLYLHTSYPEGWNLPALLTEYGIANRVLFSYICNQTKQPFIAKFEKALTTSPFTGNLCGTMPSVGVGYTEEQLAEIYNMLDLYVQYANCLGKDEEVLTSIGWKAISTIQAGELIWTHKHRWKKVLNTWRDLKISENESFKKITLYSDFETVLATNNHKFYTLSKKDIGNKSNVSLRENIGKLLYQNKKLPEISYRPLCEIENGDMLIYPIDDCIQDIDVDYSLFSNGCQVNEDFCKFMGLFVADGTSAYSNGKPAYIGIVSHEKETTNHNIVKNIFDKLNLTYKSYSYKSRHALDIRHFNTIIAEKFYQNFYDTNKEKKLPDFCLHLPINKQLCILYGMFLGDGYYRAKNNISTYSTTSKSLARQLKHILRRLRINYNVHYRDRTKDNLRDGKKRKNIYQFEIHGNFKNCIYEKPNKKHNTRNFYYENYHYLQINSIEDDIEYKDGKYNLEVEDDNSMTLTVGVSLQCEGSGIGQLEAAGCGIPIASVYYSAMADVVDKTQGIKLTPASIPRDFHLGADRAAPDNDLAADEFYKFLSLPLDYRNRKSKQARYAAEKWFNWDVSAKIWSDYFENTQLKGLQGKWDAPIQINNFNIPNELPPNMSNAQFIQWVTSEVAKKPELSFSYLGLEWLKSLNMNTINQQQIFQQCHNLGTNNIMWERARCGLEQIPMTDYIEFAHIIKESK